MLNIIAIIHEIEKRGGLGVCGCGHSDTVWTFFGEDRIGHFRVLNFACRNCGIVRQHAIDPLLPPEERETLFPSPPSISEEPPK
jgi:hypothetical protein